MQRASITPPAESEPGCADTRGYGSAGKPSDTTATGKTQDESRETSPHIYQNGQNQRSDSTRREARSRDPAQCRWKRGDGLWEQLGICALQYSSQRKPGAKCTATHSCYLQNLQTTRVPQQVGARRAAAAIGQPRWATECAQQIPHVSLGADSRPQRT